MDSQSIGVIRIGDVFISNHRAFQPHPSQDYILEIRNGKYIFRDLDVNNKEDRYHIQFTFWLDNQGHANYGMKFLDNIVEDHRNGNPLRRLSGSYTSCGERLDIEFIPWDIIKAETIAIDLLNSQARREKEDNDRKRNNLQQEQIKHWCEEERQLKKIMLEIFERNFKNP